MDYPVCRLCLGITYEKSHQLNDKSDILCKVKCWLKLNITITNEFPTQVCKQCVNKVDEINEFCTLIKENQYKLERHLKNNTLITYYDSLSNGRSIKDEKDITASKEGTQKDRLTEDEINKNNDHSVIFNDTKQDIVTVDTNESELHNDEDCIHNGSNSSDEEENKVLSSLKDDANNKNGNITIDSSHNYSCLMCDKVYDSHISLRTHYNKEHTSNNSEALKPPYKENIVNGKVMYKCIECDKMYSQYNYFKRHMLQHKSERPYICKLCGRTYKTVSDIIRHGYRAHGELKLHCSYNCGFSTSYSGALKEHEDKIHKNAYKYTCEKCGKGFTVKTWFDQHQNIHNGVKPFVCDICGAAFHMEKYLTTHRTTMHSQIVSKKPLICVHCDLKCDSVHNLTLHMQTEHGIERNKAKYIKKTLCDFCGKLLNRPEQLLLHRRMHLGEKPYHCSVCNKSFPRAYTLQVHSRTHARSRVACHVCARLYSQPSALYRHQRIHHGLPEKKKT